MGWILVGGLVLVVVVCLYISAMARLAKTSIDAAPRAPMFICDIHGPMDKQYTMKLDVGTGQDIDYCSICFHEKMKAAKNG